MDSEGHLFHFLFVQPKKSFKCFFLVYFTYLNWICFDLDTKRSIKLVSWTILAIGIISRMLIFRSYQEVVTKASKLALVTFYSTEEWNQCNVKNAENETKKFWDKDNQIQCIISNMSVEQLLKQMKNELIVAEGC